MRKAVLALGVTIAGVFLSACEDSTSANSNPNMESKVDTLVVHSYDTLVVNKYDTLVVNKKDTLVVNKLDTLILKDTLVIKDTLILNNIDTLIQNNVDTLFVKDTLFQKDTLVIKDVPPTVFGFVTDSRDKRTYRTVKIGAQEWLAENLNYRYLEATATDDSLSFCYMRDNEFCATSGRLYFWSAAMDSIGTFSDDAVGCGNGVTCDHKDTVQGICMDGWHLPSADEWQQLIDFVGGEKEAFRLLESQDDWGGRIVYYRDEETETTSNYKVTYRGVDAYGFNIRPYVTYSYPEPNNVEIYKSAYYCSSTEDGENRMISFNFSGESLSSESSMKNRFHVIMMEVDQGYSVRCVKNAE